MILTLSFLLSKLGLTPENEDCEVTGVTDNPEDVKEGSVFVCIRGNRFDGHSQAQYARQRGAAAVIGEGESDTDCCYGVENSRRAYGILCSTFYGEPEKHLKIIGITGTNGKTTTAEYICHLLNFCGCKCASIGTLGIKIDGEYMHGGFTTPGGNLLYGALARAVQAGCEYCVMEVSSQALSQYRVEPISFALGIYTNLGNDHGDYHKTTQAYIEAKSRLAKISESILVNSDDAYADKFASQYIGDKIKYYSARNGLADFMANNISFSADKISYVLFGSANAARVSFKGIGEFSVYNSLCAAAACLSMGLPFEKVAAGIGALPQVEGRAQLFYDGRGFRVCVDYAHTPDALSSILLALQKSAEGGIITVFGCGGDRDASKRPLMGKIAVNMSKSLIITSDNSRSESFEAIADDIKSSIRRKADIFTEADRERAIRLALNKAQKGDTVLIAGKGHERTQVCNGVERLFSDIECVKKYLNP